MQGGGVHGDIIGLMRLLIYLLIAVSMLSGQGFIPIPLSPLWPALREYLALSEGQVRLLSDASQSYWVASGRLMKRREELQPEILTETDRSPLRPAELGRMHEEWEMIRRRLVAVEKDRIAATRAVLNEPNWSSCGRWTNSPRAGMSLRMPLPADSRLPIVVCNRRVMSIQFVKDRIFLRLRGFPIGGLERKTTTGMPILCIQEWPDI